MNDEQTPKPPPVVIQGVDPRIARLRVGLLSYAEAEIRAEREIDTRWAHFDYLEQATAREIRDIKQRVLWAPDYAEASAPLLEYKERLQRYASSSRVGCEFIGMNTLRDAVMVGELATMRRLSAQAPNAVMFQEIVPPPQNPAPLTEIDGKLVETFIWLDYFEVWLSAVRAKYERGDEAEGGDKIHHQVILWMLDTYKPKGDPGNRKAAEVARKYQKHVLVTTGVALSTPAAVQRVTRAWDALGHPRKKNAPRQGKK